MPDKTIATNSTLRTKYLNLVKEVFGRYRAQVVRESDYTEQDLGDLFVMTKPDDDSEAPPHGTVVLIPEIHEDSHEEIYTPASQLAGVIMSAGAALSVGVEEPTYPDHHSWLPNVAADSKHRPDVIANKKKLFEAEPKAQAGVAYQLYVLQVEKAPKAPAFVWHRFPAEPRRTHHVNRNDDAVNTDMARLIDEQAAADRIIVYPVGAYHLGSVHNKTSLLQRLSTLGWELEF
ncbi:MAG TPA: hypothetical protein VGK48_17125 [Terriglobia bacterium]|jgi:hypothetical protein